MLATSGTSGASRSVMRTTDSWVASFPVVAGLTGLSSSSRVWVPGPLSATMNLFAAVHARMLGAQLVERPDEATHAHLTPSGLLALLDRGPAPGLTVVVAGDRLTPALHDRAVDAGMRVHHYYGAAELSFVAWGGHAGSLEVFPGVDLQVREGEIWVRSPYLSAGVRTDPDGFATVGDQGLLDGDRLTVLGRPGAVTVGGTTVETASVEHRLQSAAHGRVTVLGMPHHELGQVLAVVLTELDDHSAVRRLARSELHGARRPRLWWHVETLPVTPAGKVDRAALVSLLSEGGVRLV